MLLAIDVVKEVDGILDDTVAYIAVVTARLGGWSILVYHNTLAQFGVQIYFVLALFEELPFYWWCWKNSATLMY